MIIDNIKTLVLPRRTAERIYRVGMDAQERDAVFAAAARDTQPELDPNLVAVTLSSAIWERWEDVLHEESPLDRELVTELDGAFKMALGIGDDRWLMRRREEAR